MVELIRTYHVSILEISLHKCEESVRGLKRIDVCEYRCIHLCDYCLGMSLQHIFVVRLVTFVS